MKHNKAILTFDVELWHEGEWIKKSFPKNTHIRNYFEESMLPLLDALKSSGARATFFVTGQVLEKYPNLIKKVSEEGHEIASHGYIHRRLEDMSPSEFEKQTAKQVELISRITGTPPKGFRAPHFSLTNKTKWALPILAKHGFAYDSSVFPMKTPEYGVSGAPTHPYRISFNDIVKENKSSPLVEIPPAVFSWSLVRIPVAGGIYFRLTPLLIFRRMLASVSRQSAPVLYFHPHELYHKTPRAQKGNPLKKALKYYGTRNSFHKFTRLLSCFTFDSIENTLL